MDKLPDNLRQMITYSQGGILSKVIMKHPNVTLFSMAEGTEISEHTTSKQGFVLVLEGKGTFILEKRELGMVNGVFISLKKGQLHSIAAEENTSFLLVLVDPE